MYLVGSRALAAMGGTCKPDSDWDLVLTGENIKPCKGIDIAPSDLPFLDVCERYNAGEGYDVTTPVGKARVVSPIGIMLMTRSHLHRPLKFSKHITTYHGLKYVYGSKRDDRYYELLEALTKATKEKYGDRHPSLKKSKKEFFDDYVTKIYEHDDIHYATCYYDEPIYERLKPDSDLVWCSKQKWDQLSHQNRIRCVREEGFVIALERFLIPKWEKDEQAPPSKFAFDWALEKICTTLTSGWFRDFAIENWPEIRKLDWDFVGKFKDNLDKVKKYEPK